MSAERPLDGVDNPVDVQDALGDLLPSIEQALAEACRFGEGCPARLADAIRYAVLAPGKRLRPALVLMAAEACGGSARQAMPGAVAVEMIHAYSLIHDDLPAMDDDDLRRGRPTVHIEFDEATAILAGDALQPLAIAHLCRHLSDPAVIAEAVRVLATAAGPEQLVGGQADDLAAEKEHPPESDSQQRPATLALLESIHRRKTGALFAASLDLGAILSGASEPERRTLAAYAADLGLAFQVVDDLLDYTADEAEIGKRVGKDAQRGKLTYPGLMGLDPARTRARELIASARGHLAVFGQAAWRLETLARYVLNRSR
ncbi:polyprenyl synthetase family protein [Roseiconus nitratireducens]|uniref:Polyprenyl synthetase family protein n=1 Tax=Roseiconus nitratireducens TaxID=2605748 RepID=A0A5M6DM61_9BACT|nr:polyprenyl synthetase family protein [Roseiconus nitratireducens]